MVKMLLLHILFDGWKLALSPLLWIIASYIRDEIGMRLPSGGQQNSFPYVSVIITLTNVIIAWILVSFFLELIYDIYTKR